jgi:hypothetical protein
MEHEQDGRGGTLLETLREPTPVNVADRALSANKIKDMRIEELSRGFVVRVGCQAFAFSTKDELLDRLFEYIRDPDKTEAKWNNGNLF